MSNMAVPLCCHLVLMYFSSSQRLSCACLITFSWPEKGYRGCRRRDTCLTHEHTFPSLDLETPLSSSSLSLSPEPRFALKVLVRDAVTRQPLPGASVDVYVNHTLSSSDRTGPRGEVLLWVAYSPGLSLTLLGKMEGYVPGPLPWSTAKRPSESLSD